ncbi:MAG: Rpn family recombination-promoting nuclease/putative transposase, partial [Spirochaetales bacterium]|nr:Rpn family recombination-promoting nuclease/putative transposase [Spirochaetales bacterium]
MKVQNPHDKFFKELFSIENALDFINGAFPVEIKDRIIPESLKLDTSSYTDEKLDEYFSDIVYSCSIKGDMEIKISLLFEHKSYPVKYIHFQLLRYMLNIWESNIKQDTNPQLVVPMIIYHGKSGWRKREMSDYFNSKDNWLRRFVPDFDYLLTDLSSYTNNQIKDGTFKRAAIEIGLLMEKNIFNEKKLVTHLKDIINIGRLYYREEEGLKFLESVLRYLFSTTEITVDTALECIEVTDGRAREALMTTADKLMEKGIEKGLEKGIEKGIEKGTLLDKKEVLINLISKKFGVAEDDRLLIMAIEDKSKLDLVLDEILFTDSKDVL